MLKTRLILGTILLAAIALLSWLDHALESLDAPDALAAILPGDGVVGPGVVYLLVLAMLATLGSIELARMLRHANIPADTLTMTAAALLGLGATIAPILHLPIERPWILLPTCASLVLVLQTTQLIRNKHIEHAAAALASSQLAFVYLGVLPAFFILMRQDFSIGVVLSVIFLTKSCDIGAYFAGTAVGKHKLIEWLSPGKTWEGLVGGLLTSTLLGSLAAAQWGNPIGITPWHGAAIGLALGLVGQAGDLLESLLKRSTGVKDSGSVPGFGGILDMIDSPLLVAPVAYWLLLGIGLL